MFGKRFSRALALTTATSLVLATAAFADTLTADGDVLNSDTNLGISGAACDTLPDTYSTRAVIGYGGSEHFADSAVVSVSSAPDATAVTAGITTAGNGTIMMPSGWASAPSTGPDKVDREPQTHTMSVTIPSGISDGTYKVNMSASGAKAGGGTLSLPGSGNAFFNIQIDCEDASPANLAPSVDAGGNPDDGAYSGSEGTAVSLGGSASDTDGPAPLTTAWTATKTSGDTGASCSFASAASVTTTVTCNDNGTWTLRLTATDGAAATAFDEATLTVTNVAPTAALSRVGPANVFSGATVTYNAGATDPSSVDTAAGFTYSFNGGTFGLGSQLSQTYTTCGVKSESVRAQDKDGGISTAAAAGVNVFDGGFVGAIKPAIRNMVQKGRVVPVQIHITCGDSLISGLTPAIKLYNGDIDPETTGSDDALLTPTSVSAADTTGVMRPTDGGYIYNLLIPSGSAGSKYTVAVQPWGSAGATLLAVLEIRK